MGELVIRFCVGGLIVSAFALISDLFKPKTFAGLFGAAPSVALATLGLTVITQSREIAAVETRSMMIGAVALMGYAWFVSWLLMRHKLPAWKAALPGLLLWLGAAIGMWYVLLGA